MGMHEKQKKENPLYLEIYEYYKNLILLGRMKPGEKLPSIRKCALERQVSKTTIESSYMQLAAEGYIRAVAGSGYYVSEVNFEEIRRVMPRYKENTEEKKTLYDFVSSSVDDKSFDFKEWRRYMKSALRHTERLVAYGNPQGEYDLRVALMEYVKEARRVVCSPEQIVIGAGVQSLLSILCALTGVRSPICFTGHDFKQGLAVFRDRGFEVYYQRNLSEDLSFIKEKEAKMLYTFPSHMTPWGEVMPMKMRLDLLGYAGKNNCLIIEDDYGSEFRYYTRPVPSLQSLDGGQKVIYMGSFSRLLLPSLRIAFMVLPADLMEIYKEKGMLYNQTASTAEQIALCQFIRDGHLRKQIKKARKLYMTKSQELGRCIEEVFGDKAKILPNIGGFLLPFEVKSELSIKEIEAKTFEAGIKLRVADALSHEGWTCLLLSCSGVNEKDFMKSMIVLKNILFEQNKQRE